MTEIESKFMAHVSFYGLSFGTKEEYKYRLDIFKKNDAEYNLINDNSSNTYTVGHNMFSTMTEHEMKKMLGEKDYMYRPQVNATVLSTEGLAASVDWRTTGAVNPVQNQGMCGSCWTFAAAAALESHHQIEGNALIKLSEQQFVDCDDVCYGCQGGLAKYAFEYA